MGKNVCLGLLLACFIWPACLSAQSLLQPSGAVWQYAAGVGGWKEDAFGALRHPAMPGAKGHMSMGLSAESVSGLSGMTMISAVAGFRLGRGVAGACLDHRSMAGSGETRLSFGYALPLSSTLRAGLRLGFQGLRIPAHRAITAIPVEWGLVYRYQRLSVGFSAGLPVALTRDPGMTRSPSVFRVTTACEVGPGAGLALDVIREEGWGLSCRPMVFYQPAAAFRLTTGVTAGDGSFFFGTRHQRSVWGVTLFFQRHPLLGWTGSFSIDRNIESEDER